MKKTRRDKFEALGKLFDDKKVLKIEDISKVVGSPSRRTVLRYIKDLRYLTSYTHKGRYYTLEETVKFNEHGLCHFGDVGFSKHGSLFDTLTYFIEISEAGLTCNELQKEAHTTVKYAMQDLVEMEKISRSKPQKVYVYTSSDPLISKKQLDKRQNIEDDLVIDQDTAFRVLVAAYRLVEKIPSAEKVAAYLQNEGSNITLETVRKVFRRYEIEKKTTDSVSLTS